MNASILAGKRAVVTGASRGIGFGIARALAQNGVACILVGRNSNTLDARIAEMPLKSSGHITLVGDVSSPNTWSQFERNYVSFSWCH
jgi:NAD(P)-dependent dehydrogenase (short-subunit alcohol dehydrogenase family)